MLPVYSSAARLYAQAGWTAVLPVPTEGKWPPPTGYTGDAGIDTTPEQIEQWAGNGYGGHSIALRMPDGVIGIDVDQYMKGGRQKIGALTLAQCIERCGPLPPTWSSTARGDGPSRIYFYRVPSGRWRSVIQPDVEVIQRHHRYAVVWPSINDEAGGAGYRWYFPDGSLVPEGRVPAPAELTELTPEAYGAWLQFLLEGASDAGPAAAEHGAGWELLGNINQDHRDPCAEMNDALDKIEALEGLDFGTRHDAVRDRVYHAVMLAAHGHAGFGTVAAELATRWDALTAGENRSEEFQRMLTTGARKAVTAIGGTVPLPVDPCAAAGGSRWAGVSPMVPVDSRPRPADNRSTSEDGEPSQGEPLRLELPPRPADPSWTMVIGSGAFDPGVELDQPMGDAMLYRTYPMTRRATDTRNAWLLRGAEQWTLEGDLSRRIVAECAHLMPQGDPNPPGPGEPASEGFRLFKRRNRMLTNAGAGGVAGMIRALTDGGRHPAAVKLSDLDKDPEILWAGGVAWNLRESRAQPVWAPHIDPNTPHLSAAGVYPALVPTPGWDRFIAAIWPDPEVRAWCLRVLSIAATGYPDAALPILYGDGGTGKTSLITLLMEVLGSYAHAADHRLLGAGDTHASIVFALMGKRLSFIDEAMREGTRNAERLKQLTGGGQLTGNAMNQNPVTFNPTHTLVLTSNLPPTVHDAALRRRIRLLPCDGDPAEVRAARQALTASWGHEAPGVLATIMAEAAGWLANPDSALMSAAPLAVRSALDELVTEQDVVGTWLAEHVVPNDHGTRSRPLYVGFRNWCRDGGVRDSAIPTEKAWAAALTEAGYPAIPRRDGNYRPLVVRGDGGFAPIPGPVVQVTEPVQSPSTGYPQGGGNFSGPGHTERSTVEGQVFAPSTGGLAPSNNASTSDNVSPEGLNRGPGAWTDDSPPSTADKPSSGPVFDGSVEGVDGSSSSLTYRENPPPIQEHRPGNAPHPPQAIFKPTGEAPISAGSEVARGGVEGQPDPPQPSTGQLALIPPLPITLDPSRKVTVAEVARVATELGVKRGEARSLIKEATRRVALRLAAGALVALPAIVDRSGRVIACTEAEARALVARAIARSTALTVDVETSGYPLGHRHYQLRLVQLGDDLEAALLHPVEHAQLIRELLGGDFPMHAHSAGADLVPLDEAQLLDMEGAWPRMHDTVIPAKLADPTSTGADPALKRLSPAMLGTDSTVEAADKARKELFKAGGWLLDTDADTPPERNGWAQVEINCETMLRYGGSDVLDTAAIAKRLPVPPPRIYHRERLAQRMTARVTRHGVPLDYDLIRELTARHSAEQAEAAARVREVHPIDNPGSPAQVAAVLEGLGIVLPRTEPSSKFPQGQPSVAEGTLEPLADEDHGRASAFARELLTYREHSTALGTFLRPYAALCELGDGRARPTVYTLGTNTGRMSCVRPNAQQLPRAGGFRAMYRADPGMVMIGADFSGVELRVAAALSGDPWLTNLIMTGGDLHAEIALMVFNEPDPEASAERGRPWPFKRHRYKVKSGVFGRLYGGGAPTLASQMGVRLPIAQRMIDVLDHQMPTLSAWSDYMREQVKRGHTQFPTYSGRVVHLPAAWPHKAPNYAIQGTARELLVDALEQWDTTPWRGCTLLPVHDELDVWVPEAEAEEAQRALVACMATELSGIPIVAEPDKHLPGLYWPDSE